MCRYRDGRQEVSNLVNQEYVMLQNPETEIGWGQSKWGTRVQHLQGTYSPGANSVLAPPWDGMPPQNLHLACAIVVLTLLMNQKSASIKVKGEKNNRDIIIKGWSNQKKKGLSKQFPKPLWPWSWHGENTLIFSTAQIIKLIFEVDKRHSS